MRIIRYEVNTDAAELLGEVSKMQGFDDRGFVEDLYSLLRLKGQGLPDKTRMEKMAENVATKHKKNKMGVLLLMAKRKQVLERLIALPYFKALSANKNLIQSVERVLTTFQTLYRKARQAQCMSCSLRTSCDFGKQYGEVMSDITKVIDADFSTKVHNDCPHLPEIGAMNQLGAAVAQFNQMASGAMKPFTKLASKSGAGGVDKLEGEDEDEDSAVEDDEIPPNDPDAVEDNYVPFNFGGAAGGNMYMNAHTASHICKVTEDAINEVTSAQLLLYELGRNFDVALNSDGVTNFKPVTEVERDQTQKHMESEKDITNLVSSQHGLPEEVFDARAEKKQLTKVNYVKPEDAKRQLLYLLIDSSSSMASALGNGRQKQALYTRAALASVFSLALMRKVRREGGIVFVRFFEGNVSPLYSAKELNEWDRLLTLVTNNNYGGWSTDLNVALSAAVADIDKAAKTEDLARAEILMITDCEDSSFKAAPVKTIIGKREVNVLDVAGGTQKENPELKAISTKYMKVNEASPDVNKMVQLI